MSQLLRAKKCRRERLEERFDNLASIVDSERFAAIIAAQSREIDEFLTAPEHRVDRGIAGRIADSDDMAKLVDVESRALGAACGPHLAQVLELAVLPEKRMRRGFSFERAESDGLAAMLGSEVT